MLQGIFREFSLMTSNHFELYLLVIAVRFVCCRYHKTPSFTISLHSTAACHVSATEQFVDDFSHANVHEIFSDFKTLVNLFTWFVLNFISASTENLKFSQIDCNQFDFHRNTVSRFTNSNINSLDSKIFILSAAYDEFKTQTEKQFFHASKKKIFTETSKAKRSKKEIKQNILKRGLRWFIQHILPTTLPCHKRYRLASDLWLVWKSIIHRQH